MDDDYSEPVQAERVAASLEGSQATRPTSPTLDDEISDARSAHVGAAVTEMATLRAEL